MKLNIIVCAFCSLVVFWGYAALKFFETGVFVENTSATLLIIHY